MKRGKDSRKLNSAVKVCQVRVMMTTRSDQHSNLGYYSPDDSLEGSTDFSTKK